MTKLIIIVSAALGAATIGVSPVSAQSCVDQYQSCLNDSWDTKGALRVLADLECGAEYAGCVADKLRNG